VSLYQKGKTSLDFTEARDSEWQWHQLGHMQVCTLLQTDYHTSTPPIIFYRPDALPSAQPIASKHWTIRYNTRCYFNVRSKADMSQLNLPHGTHKAHKTKNIIVCKVLGAISAGVEMSLVSAWRQQLMLIAGYAQEVSCRRKDRRNRTHVDHSLTRCSGFYNNRYSPKHMVANNVNKEK